MIGDERAAVVAFIGGGGGHAGEVTRIAEREAAQRLDQLIAVVREVQNHAEFAAEGHHAGQVGGGHLRLHPLDGGLLSARLFQGLHGGHVEEQSDKAAILITLGIARGLCVDGRAGRRRGSAFFECLRPLRERHGRERIGAEILLIEDRDLLGHAVFQQLKIFFFESGDGAAGLVLHRDVDHHEFGVDDKGRVLREQKGSGREEEGAFYQDLGHQKLNLSVALKLRMLPAERGTP